MSLQYGSQRVSAAVADGMMIQSLTNESGPSRLLDYYLTTPVNEHVEAMNKYEYLA